MDGFLECYVSVNLNPCTKSRAIQRGLGIEVVPQETGIIDLGNFGGYWAGVKRFQKKCREEPGNQFCIATSEYILISYVAHDILDDCGLCSVCVKNQLESKEFKLILQAQLEYPRRWGISSVQKPLKSDPRLMIGIRNDGGRHGGFLYALRVVLFHIKRIS